MKFSALAALVAPALAATTASSSSSADETITIPASISSLAAEYTNLYQPSTCLYESQELLEHGLLFIETFLYPANSEQADMINSTMFSEDVVGRIDVTRTYVGRELNTEYIFGLFVSIANTNFTNMFGYATDYDIYEFSARCDEYSVSVVFNATFPLFNNMWIPFEGNLWVKLNDKMQVTQYDLQFKRWQTFYDYILKMASYGLTGVHKNSTQTLTDSEMAGVGEIIAASVCAVHDAYCTGDNQQYDSYDDCVDYLTNIRFGTSIEGGRDTLFCRSLHQNMVSYRPGTHCPHIGPSGGDMCLDDEATEYFNLVYNYDETFEYGWIVV